MYSLLFSLLFMQVVGVVQRADPTLTRVEILRRGPVNDSLDAVVAIGSDKFRPVGRLILLLQSRADPGLVYLLGIKAAIPDCVPMVERISTTEVIGSCGAENYGRKPNWKFLFDPRAKALVNFVTYLPFSMDRVFASGDSAIFLGSNTEVLKAIEYRPGREPEFRIMSAVESSPWFARVHVVRGSVGLPPYPVISIEHEKPVAPRIPLPQTTYDQFAAARPERVKMGYVRASTEVHDGIGPWVKDNGLIWFGKSFYDGEGQTGVGGFGYLDIATHKVKLYSPREIADYSVSAINVGPDDVWMGLFWFGELSSDGGGLLRFDRHTEGVERIPLRDIAADFARLDRQILAATSSGAAIVEGNAVRRFFLDRTSDGRWGVVESN